MYSRALPEVIDDKVGAVPEDVYGEGVVEDP
jgi:hypothetical protein